MKRKMKYKVKADMFNKELFVLTADDFDYREIFAVGVAE